MQIVHDFLVGPTSTTLYAGDPALKMLGALGGIARKQAGALGALRSDGASVGT